MAQAFVTNGIVIYDDGNRVKWHPICQKCGHVQANVTMNGYCTSRTLAGYTTCVRCRETLKHEIFRK